VSSPSTIVIVLPVVLVALLIVGTVITRRRGYSIGGECVVRCVQGHLFTTIWLPGGSIKAIRLGWFRIQWCPVGEHWTVVVPVKDSDLTDRERRFAEQHRDVRVP
jgi:hypothetical protein